MTFQLTLYGTFTLLKSKLESPRDPTAEPCSQSVYSPALG